MEVIILSAQTFFYLEGQWTLEGFNKLTLRGVGFMNP